MRRRRFSLDFSHDVEILECRAVPTAIIGMTHAAMVAQTSQVHANSTFATISGTYTVPRISNGVDSGITNTFSAHGTLPIVGHVKLTGTIQGTGNIAVGQASGEITLTTSKGSVTLLLVGPNQGMFAALPGTFQFSVVSATGRFASVQMSGTINLVEHPRVHTFSMSLVSVQFSDPNALSGTGSGAYSTGFAVDAGPRTHLRGTSTTELLGQVKVTGDVQGTGFTTSGQATGTITLSNKEGSVTLSLKGPVQQGFSRLPTQFQFEVTASTGLYKGLRLIGLLNLTLDPITTLGGTGVFHLEIPATTSTT